jgi:phospholipid transport system substrate-binding protein
MTKRLIAFLFLFAPIVAPVRAFGTESPMAQLKQQNERIDKILKRKPAAGSPDEQSAKSELKAAVNHLIDYRELAQRALSDHWGKLSAAQQEEFVSTLRELIEKNYVKQLRSTLEYEVMYKKEQLADSEATINTTVKVRTKGKSTDTAIDYKMKRSKDQWLVYDVITDDVSMLRNYKNQFNKIISQESYDALIKKMRKKIEEPDGASAK